MGSTRRAASPVERPGATMILTRALSFVLIGTLLVASGNADPQKPMPDGQQSKRCAGRRDLVGQCFTIRGRLNFYNGGTNFRIWRVGTTRILGLEQSDDNPNVPTNVGAYLQRLFEEGLSLFGDFTVCPLTAQKLGEMQYICVESAANLVARKVPDVY
jgi:hypothetical protein